MNPFDIRAMVTTMRILYGTGWLFIPDAYHTFDRMMDSAKLAQYDRTARMP